MFKDDINGCLNNWDSRDSLFRSKTPLGLEKLSYQAKYLKVLTKFSSIETQKVIGRGKIFGHALQKMSCIKCKECTSHIFNDIFILNIKANQWHSLSRPIFPIRSPLRCTPISQLSIYNSFEQIQCTTNRTS